MMNTIAFAHWQANWNGSILASPSQQIQGAAAQLFKSVPVEWTIEKPGENKGHIHINEAPVSGEGRFVLSPVCIILPF